MCMLKYNVVFYTAWRGIVHLSLLYILCSFYSFSCLKMLYNILLYINWPFMKILLHNTMIGRGVLHITWSLGGYCYTSPDHWGFGVLLCWYSHSIGDLNKPHYGWHAKDPMPWICINHIVLNNFETLS
jgi:hypothetical protein